MDEIDRKLRRRLEALAHAVPMSIEPSHMARLPRAATRSPLSNFSALVAATGIMLIVTVAIALAGRAGPPAAASPVPAVTTSPVASATGRTSATRSPAIDVTPEPSAPPTRPPAGVALPYPDGCPAYGLSPRRCAYIIDWALAQAGVTADAATVQLLGDPACDGQPAGCIAVPVRLGGEFVVRVRVTPTDGGSTDHPVFCGLGGETTMLCTDAPVIWLSSPMSGYADVPCGPVPGGEPGSHCATPLPTIAPSAAERAVALRTSEVMITIDHAGTYVVDLGDAVLPNGILSAATATLVEDRRSDVLIPDGIQLEVLGPDGKALLNAYDQRWRPGTERVHVRLVFIVKSFDPGTTLDITDVVVR